FALRHDQISMGHARALISIPEPELQLKALLRIVEKGLSVRETEKLAKDILVPHKKEDTSVTLDENLRNAGIRLHERIGASVSIKSNNKGQGSLVIKFQSENELERILRVLNQD
ncbi:MAG: chromosome partitioning protein ParB, partial [Bacteroidales bacterium]|nr:chromosome partitioning protein ParB [Bacteroidales bacterium]